MIRLFKHYIPHAVLLLGLLDLALLVVASELAWQLRAAQIGMDAGPLETRWLPLIGSAAVVWLAMISVGVYGPLALRSLRFAGARLLVAISLGIIALAFVDFVLPGQTFWRSTLLYAMGFAVLVLVADRLLLNSFLGSSAFRRRVMVLGAGDRAQRLRELGDRPESGFAIVS
ncbi:MAG: sugar transferase, partial [Pseudomonadota bacterium]